jgi:hypothetical protein
LAITALLALTTACALVPAAQAKTSPVQKLCVTAFPAANQTHRGGTTSYNRQASVQAVGCGGFGFDTKFHVDGGIVCSLISAAVGEKYNHLALYIDGSCAGPTLAANHDVGTVSGEACSMLSDLLTAAPWARTYALGVGVACQFGKPTGTWIESRDERQAAGGVIRSGRCLRFITHSFPLPDDWSAVPCAPGDRGFSDGSSSAPKQATEVLSVEPVDANYQPIAGLAIRDRGSASSCGAGSDSVSNAYRCFSGNGVYDPCWTDNSDPAAAAVLCLLRPWEKQATRFTLEQGGLQPFYTPPIPNSALQPWGVELATGERCIAAQGAHDTVNGGHRVVDYGCVNKSGRRDDRVLLRGIERNRPRWRIATAFYNRRTGRYKLGAKIFIDTAWYAIPDGGDAAAAAANTCSASALAFAAEAYEASHNEPDGPLPEINRHGCAGGYAIVGFEQEAPPPGYEAQIAFHASPTGWAFLGASGYVESGDFGIPEDAYDQIASQLRATRESVPF